jgi:tRNA (guanine37-N1)-methyltransferase
MFRAISDYGITSRAVHQGLLQLQYWNPRDFAEDRHQTVDDRPYGGGPGMVMKVYPTRHAILEARKAASGKAKVIYLSPQGRRLETEAIRKLALEQELIFLAGRYEGVDERLLTQEIDEEWSIGDYVLTGGELATMVVIDAITRWLPGALGDDESALQDSFVTGLLDCPHYTRPPVIEGLSVPEVLLSGNHAAIAEWRLRQKLGRTWLRRQDLLEKLDLSIQCQKLLQEFIREHERGEHHE